ncbi:hypothetical protein BTH42_26010 [Burkholderia sp. SRS-W-2-2016]|uniref:FkbM family methyltransferase n=1 Tax=Burkholderia sp. SRS-W-2-2016 TaxID=1926878 RepID=UPI00094B34F5|nr:FkbM family methyltransferase [Burkholderia sp. SRS-W-2-2016]OLL28685.1 hypothetical protein BTH42_26010 [Burkholderia sp. SRS-W-2-2016]
MANNTGTNEQFESRVTELQQENELLLVQLHHAQEELERNYSRAEPAVPKMTADSKSGAANASTIASVWVADELPEMHAENRRLRALVEAQKRIHERESNHALNARLGNILIEGVDAPGSLLSMPGKLVRIWRQSTRRTPPAALGGKDFSKIIAAWQSGGFNAVEKAMGTRSVAPAMQAQGYTALARHLGKGDRANAAEAARRAYDLDPKSFRLKWLAFRLHEAGEVVEAEAMLELLPVDVQFSESEARQAKQLRNEAKRARDSEAKQQTAFAERRAAADKQLSNLAHERDQQSRLATDRAREVAALKQSKAKLEQEKVALSARYEAQVRLLDECNRELEAIKRAKSQLQNENAVLVAQCDQNETRLRDALDMSIQKSDDNELLLANLHRVQEELAQVFAERESLQSANVQLETQVRDTLDVSIQRNGDNELLLVNLHRIQGELEQVRAERESLQSANVQLQTQVDEALDVSIQKSTDNESLQANLHRIQAELEQVLAERERLQSANVQLETRVRDAAERASEIEALKKSAAGMEQDKRALESSYEKLRELAQERARELEAVKLSKLTIEDEKQVLAVRHQVELRIAEERHRELEALRLAKTLMEQEKQSLTVKYELQSAVVVERVKEIDTLKHAANQLRKEKQSLSEARDAQSRLAEDRKIEMEALKQAKAKLEQDKVALKEKHDSQVKVAEARNVELQAVKQAQTDLEQQTTALQAGRDAQQKLAEDRNRQVTTLKEEKAKLEQEKSLLEKQKRSSVGSETRGDADIDDLIADLELFFNGKSIIYVDVGAYMGNVFMKFNRSIEKFRIHEAHLFEPNPVSYQQLLKKTAGMDKPVVHTYNLAVSEAHETHRFVPAKTMTKAIAPEIDSANVSGDMFTASCVSLDKQSTIFTDGKINLLKIDVEGKELDVLRSARQLLAGQNVDVLYIEVGFNRTGTQQTYFAEIDQFLQEFGYRVLRIYEQKEEWMNDSPLLRRANIAYMSERFANAHPLKLMKEIGELKDRINELSLGVRDSKVEN